MTEFEMYDKVLRKVGYKKLKDNKYDGSFPVYVNGGINISLQLDTSDNIAEWIDDSYSSKNKTKEDFYNNNLALFRQLKLMMLIDE